MSKLFQYAGTAAGAAPICFGIGAALIGLQAAHASPPTPLASRSSGPRLHDPN